MWIDGKRQSGLRACVDHNSEHGRFVHFVAVSSRRRVNLVFITLLGWAYESILLTFIED